MNYVLILGTVKMILRASRVLSSSTTLGRSFHRTSKVIPQRLDTRADRNPGDTIRSRQAILAQSGLVSLFPNSAIPSLAVATRHSLSFWVPFFRILTCIHRSQYCAVSPNQSYE